MLRILINNTFLNDICGRVLGGQSRIVKSVLVFLLLAAGVLLAGLLHFAAYFNLRHFTFFRHFSQPQIKTT